MKKPSITSKKKSESLAALKLNLKSSLLLNLGDVVFLRSLLQDVQTSMIENKDDIVDEMDVERFTEFIDGLEIKLSAIIEQTKENSKDE